MNMQTIELTYPHGLAMSELPETISAIGFFDGIHQGHKAVIQQAVQIAEKENKTSAVISFYPHPSVVLQKNVTGAKYITTIEEKKNLLEELGVDRFYIISFNKELSLLPPKEFIDHFIIGLHITHLVAGYDFTFGHKGKGNMKNIEEYQQGKFAVTAVNKVEIDGDKASSTNIRKALENGNAAEAAGILGRHYETTGTVVRGDQRGKQLGYPTANLDIDAEKLLPKQGIYAVTMNVGGVNYEGMANLGTNPTFVENAENPIVEVNLFQFDKDIYGETATVYWHAFIRPEEKFDSAEELITQMQDDEKQVKAFFSQEKQD